LHLVVAGLVAAGGLFASWSAERNSVERANRLQREGRSEEAARLYRERTARDPADPELRYNLGTTLLGLDSLDAELELSRALRGGSREIRGRARYNTGLSQLEQAIEAIEPDSIRSHATAAVEANRAAIRLRPEDPDAKWNLAMALRLLDSIDAVERRSGRELMDGAVEADVVTRSVNVPDAAEDEFAEDPPAEGETETVALVGDEAPLTPEEAAEILGRSHLDATQILTKLIALESRMRWGRQPSRGVRRW
jgi:tetratricopeptide (TPR) repeat protein